MPPMSLALLAVSVASSTACMLPWPGGLSKNPPSFAVLAPAPRGVARILLGTACCAPGRSPASELPRDGRSLLPGQVCQSPADA